MIDRREEILSRLVEVCGAVEGILRVARNKTDVSGKKRPAVVVLDADEGADPHAFDRGRPPLAPNIIHLTPEIYLMDARPVGAGAATGDVDLLGPSLNALRIKLVKAVLSDSVLRSSCGTNGAIYYDGCVTDLARGRSMEGEMVVNFTFRYFLNPQEF